MLSHFVRVPSLDTHVYSVIMLASCTEYTSLTELSDHLRSGCRFSDAFQHRLEAYELQEIEWVCFHANCKTVTSLHNLSYPERLTLVTRCLKFYQLLTYTLEHTKYLLHQFFEVPLVESIPDMNRILPEIENKSQLWTRLHESLTTIGFLFGKEVQAQVLSNMRHSKDFFFAGCRELAEALARINALGDDFQPAAYQYKKRRDLKDLQKINLKTLRDCLMFGAIAAAPGMDPGAVKAVFEQVIFEQVVGDTSAGENLVGQLRNGFRQEMEHIVWFAKTGKTPANNGPDPQQLQEDQEQEEDATSIPKGVDQDEVTDHTDLENHEHAQVALAVSKTEAERTASSEAKARLQRAFDECNNNISHNTSASSASSSSSSSSSSSGTTPAAAQSSRKSVAQLDEAEAKLQRHCDSSHNSTSEASRKSVAPLPHIKPSMALSQRLAKYYANWLLPSSPGRVISTLNMEPIQPRSSGSSSSSSKSNSSGVQPVALPSSAMDLHVESARHLEIMERLHCIEDQLQELQPWKSLTAKKAQHPVRSSWESEPDSDDDDNDRMSCSSANSVLQEYHVPDSPRALSAFHLSSDGVQVGLIACSDCSNGV